MGVLNANKKIDVSQIDCEGTMRVTLALTAAPNIQSSPTDIVLVLDRSGSMAGTPFANLKLGAKTFIDIIDEATDSSQDGNIGSGSRIGIVSFAENAVANTQLITSVDTLKAAVDGLAAGGATNHAAAFSEAMDLFDPASPNAKVIVMFTDGKTTAGPPPAPVAAAARASGIVIYCIGLVGSDGVDPNTLNEWATDPNASHVAVTPDAADLEELFADLAVNISKPGATQIVIDEEVNHDFAIISVSPPDKGSAVTVDAHKLQWKIDALGVTGNEGAALEFFVRHTGDTGGTKLVNLDIRYADAEGNAVTFPNPSVRVDCRAVVHPEKCPTPVDVTVGGCQDSILVDLGDAYLESLGRIVQLDVTVKNVCPGKRVALAMILTEVDQNGMEYQRGMKAFTLPAHSFPTCRDVLVKCVKFVLPEDLDVSGKSPRSLCGKRNLKVRVIAHNIDTDYRCCEAVVTL